ncbi:hypothetical protein Y11_36901 [Yersinia enterocolitica subsp. palearctica Y11]|uniref:Uncharacterized protein n=2 Tax=Yersinia enterocolitica TaxID=630 RepID=A0A0H3NW88_YERE1|nr:unknown protein [Yersinia enterocolitica W22703]CBY28840.1 hypothetical protein Y11_36901 [Yersinia enterocolitica subsp. palearctica Y11]
MLAKSRYQAISRHKSFSLGGCAENVSAKRDKYRERGAMIAPS